MKDFKIAIQKVIKRAVESFYNFPASIFSAIIIAIVAFIRIEMDYDVEQSYNVLFDSIQLAFVFAAVFSMALIALRQLDKTKISKSIASISGLVIGTVAFLLLYLFGGNANEQGIMYLTDISMARITVAIFISIVIFIYIISKNSNIKEFPSAFFITHKAFVISAIYGLVLMIGISGVLGAFQTLVYRDMDNKIFQYVGVIIGFLTYAIFLGYFPIFNNQEVYENKDDKEIQPRFIVVLFDYILVPIIIALTLVLFSWSARVLFKGLDVSFNQLSSISTSYVLVGIWLHIMVANHDTGITKFYRKAYPFSAILILSFEGWALIVQLGESGLKTTEYLFVLLWVFAAISVAFLIFNKEKSYRKIAIVAAVISLIAVLPLVGYHILPLKNQINRVEKILIQENLLIDGRIVVKEQEIDKIKRENITDAVDFIAYSRDGQKPSWFKEELSNEAVFKDTFGFQKVYRVEDYPGQSEYFSTNLILTTQAIDISDYDVSINIGFNEKDKSSIFFEKNGIDYEIIWDLMENGIPKLTVKMGDRILIERDLEEFLTKIENKYPPNDYKDINVPLEDMSLKIETDEISMLLVFNNINIFNDTSQVRRDYYMDLNSIYIK
ncbi:MAG: DUF4153 domain-containing protein [Gudongella sp.]|nr:DUF4153 domain-containing protein [Gudongella sp.]